MTYDPVKFFVNQLAEHGKSARFQGGEFKAQCPAHDDEGPSLQVGYGDKGAVVFCHAGCATEAIVAALGMTMEQLYEDPLESAAVMPLHAAAPGAEATYVYEDEHGHVLFRVERRRNADGTKTFRQAHPNPAEPGQWINNMGNTRRVPFHLPSVLAAAAENEWVFIVEGEKDVLRLEAEGLVATTNPGGAGKFKREYAEFFAGANVVLIPDNDDVGHEHMKAVADYLSKIALTVRLLVLDVPPKGDVSDWLDMDPSLPIVNTLLDCYGHPTIDSWNHDGDHLVSLALGVRPMHTNKPAIFNANALMHEQFEDVVMAVPGIIAEGVTLLVGAPKVSKSWMALALGLAVAEGSKALGTIPVQQGKVLYLSLEDTPRRLQRRMTMLRGEFDPPVDLEFACMWPRLNAGGLDALEDWIKANPKARMVIIDTWAKVKPGVTDGGSMYQDDYAAITSVKTLADMYGIAIVLVHHQRKAADGDPLNTVAGSTGFTGAADAIVILTRQRGSEEGHLYVTGRDVEETMNLLLFDQETGNWTWLGETDMPTEVDSRETQVLDLLRVTPDPIGPKAVAEKLDMPDGTAKYVLSTLTRAEKIRKVGRGLYECLASERIGDPGPNAGMDQIEMPGLTDIVGDPVPLEEIEDLMDAAEFGAADPEEF